MRSPSRCVFSSSSNTCHASIFRHLFIPLVYVHLYGHLFIPLRDPVLHPSSGTSSSLIVRHMFFIPLQAPLLHSFWGTCSSFFFMHLFILLQVPSCSLFLFMHLFFIPLQVPVLCFFSCRHLFIPRLATVNSCSGMSCVCNIISCTSFSSFLTLWPCLWLRQYFSSISCPAYNSGSFFQKSTILSISTPHITLGTIIFLYIHPFAPRSNPLFLAHCKARIPYSPTFGMYLIRDIPLYPSIHHHIRPEVFTTGNFLRYLFTRLHSNSTNILNTYMVPLK